MKVGVRRVIILLGLGLGIKFRLSICGLPRGVWIIIRRRLWLRFCWRSVCGVIILIGLGGSLMKILHLWARSFVWLLSVLSDLCRFGIGVWVRSRLMFRRFRRFLLVL